jgi:ribosomal-protein-alanine N-acetyltransferase
METKIEDASIKHLDKLFEIEQQCFTNEAFTKRQIAYLLTDYNTISLIAKTNNQITGFIITQIENQQNKTIGHIITINVSPPYRRKGIAQKLLNQTETILKNRKINETHLEVRQDNIAAINLYQKQGYKKIEELKNYYKTTHGIHLKKNLQTNI